MCLLVSITNKSLCSKFILYQNLAFSAQTTKLRLFVSWDLEKYTWQFLSRVTTGLFRFSIGYSHKLLHPAVLMPGHARGMLQPTSKRVLLCSCCARSLLLGLWLTTVRAEGWTIQSGQQGVSYRSYAMFSGRGINLSTQFWWKSIYGCKQVEDIMHCLLLCPLYMVPWEFYFFLKNNVLFSMGSQIDPP